MRAYYMRLHVADAVEAERLVTALAETASPQAVGLERHGQVVSVLWPAAKADEPAEWDEQAFAELVFFLRAWSGTDPRREIIVLEERPMDVEADRFRDVS